MSLSELIAQNIANRVHKYEYYSSSVFRHDDKQVYIDILNTVNDRRPATQLLGDSCFLKLVPYSQLIQIHTNVIHFLNNPGAYLILKNRIDQLLRQL